MYQKPVQNFYKILPKNDLDHDYVPQHFIVDTWNISRLHQITVALTRCALNQLFFSFFFLYHFISIFNTYVFKIEIKIYRTINSENTND